MNTDQQTFLALWDKFTTRLKGKLLRQLQKGSLDAGTLKLMLLNASAGWDSEQEEGGRWLHHYTQAHPKKGKLLRDILVEDMRFTEVTPQKTLPQAMEYILPVGGAAVGLGISTFFQAGWAVRAAATIGPGVLLYPAVKAVGDGSRKRGLRTTMDEYMEQLDKFKESALSVLDD